jgi:hypothetical protein
MLRRLSEGALDFRSLPRTTAGAQRHSLLRIRNKELDRDDEISPLPDLLRRSRGAVEGKFGDLAEIRGNQQGRTSLDRAVWTEFPTLADRLRHDALEAETRIRSGLRCEVSVRREPSSTGV